ncbi:MAG: hypothetical protein QOH90_1239 [Actinomycetota bacterium]|jgi:hypothetical protein|nr:hypothetical protein [Actinomycetota bacterium]
MDLNRLSTGEKTLGISAALLFLLSFAGIWAKVEVKGAGLGDATTKFSAWNGYGFLMKLALILALIAVAVVVARAAGVDMSLPYGQLYLGLGGATFLFLLLTLLIGPDESGSGSLGLISVEISRGIGLFIGTLLAALMAFGAWMHYSGGDTATTPSPAMPEAPPPAV